MESLKVSNLCKTYIVNKRQNNVLRNVNLEIRAGEMAAIMGPSGSGKTTLLYTVSGMDDATAGKVDFYGRDLTLMINCFSRVSAGLRNINVPSGHSLRVTI